MQTSFPAARLADPHVREANDILRTCVHCGYCLATCPTYLLLGDELDSPRGRIYLAKDMLEKDRPATADDVKHIDRCLTCLACMTTCPSGVDYAHLVDRARVHIENTYRRPWFDRVLRHILATVVPNPTLFRTALLFGQFGRPFRRLLSGRLGAMAAMAPKHLPPPSATDRPQVFPARGPRRRRVALLPVCAQRVLRPETNEATIRLLTGLGVDVVLAKGSGCCGAIVHHMGWEDRSRAAARANVAAWMREIDGDGLDAVVFNASGCGVSVKDYGHLLSDDPEWAASAARIAAMATDVSQLLIDLELRPKAIEPVRTVAYHPACSMQHGLGLRTQSKELLSRAGFRVVEPAEAHICCGSAGSYSILQPALAGALRERKVANLEALKPDIIATGNIGCIQHLGPETSVPVVHTVELLDWAMGGPRPAAMADVPERPGPGVTVPAGTV
ncbi:MAG: glycolate oxidase iron-sulfur subunit [Rhodospirillales bacterium]|nr:MAG: glycolate oxidase iron-sulfur subunit [Rhodospirillales bacterium]